MTNVGDIVTVDDAYNADSKVPAIVTAVADDGSVSLFVFGTSDVVEKRHAVTLDTDDDDTETDDEPEFVEPTATSGRRAKTATTFDDGTN